MASEKDVEEENADKNILYDLTIHAEWKQENELFRKTFSKDVNVSAFGRLTSSTQRAGWTFLRTLGLPIQVNNKLLTDNRRQPYARRKSYDGSPWFRTASPCYLPPSLVKLVNCKINWHIAVGRDGKNVAVLQDQSIEIRSSRDAYGTVTGRVSVQRDPYPQWRHLVWSPDSTMVACSYSSGVVEVFDIVGTLLFTIPGGEKSPNPSLPTDLSGSVAALIFTDVKPAEDWSSELLVINFDGSLRSYRVDRDQGYEQQHSFLFNNCYPLGISSVVYHPGAGLLYVGGCGSEEDGSSKAMVEGLTAWRILSDYPHYKLVTDYSEDLRQSQKQRSLVKRLRLPSLKYFKKENQDGVFKMSLSPTGKYLAVVHFSGKFSLWSMPALKLMKMWSHAEQPNSNDLSPEFTEMPHLRKQLKDLVPTRKLIDVNWWSDEAVILARCTGAVTVSSIKTLKNLLGTNPEWFEPAPHVGPVHDGGFLGLEVECRFPSKRRLMISDDAEEEESDEDEGIGTKTSRYTKQVLHYVTDMERFQPPRKKTKLVNRTYRLVCLKSTTPEELYARKLDNEEYGEAKALAEAYGLDCDLVYQRQWRKSPVEIASIQDYLSKISKRSWVLHECLERMSDSVDAMKELLEFGLRGTDLPALIMIGKGEDHGRFILCDEDEGLYEDMDIDPYDPNASIQREELKQRRQEELLGQVDFNNLTLEQRELCKARKKLVQYLYRLKTYECILGGVNFAAERFDSKFFERFRSQNIVETAVEYAQAGDWKALETLFTFHSEELLPHRLAVLSNFPETSNPSEYKALLPEISDGSLVCWDSDRWNKCDWVEIDPCKTAIEQAHQDLGDFLYDQHPPLKKFWNADSPDVISKWYKYRAFEIERLSRQADYSLELVKLGVERGVQGLDMILDDLVTMEMLVYDCHIDDTLTFQQLQEMADYEKLELIMKQSTDEMYSKNVKKWLVPFLRQCERKTKGTYNSLLRDYIVTTANTDLTRPLKVFELSKTHLGSPVIVTQTELMSTAIEALYGCNRDDQHELAMEVLKCLPQRGVGAETREIQKLHEQVDQLEHHLNASRILEENGIKKPLYFIKNTETSADEAEQLIIKITRMAGRREPTLSEAQWSKIHGDIIELQDKVYRCISQGLCHEIFVESLLCSSNMNNIQLAGKLVERTEEESRKPTPRKYNMQTRVPYDRAIELILAASQEYFNSAADLTDQCMVLARSCLNLIQDSPAKIQEEHDLIASLSLLDEFGVKILPLQVRLCKDRLDLVRQAIHSKDGAYKQKQKFVRLGHLLRVSTTDTTDREGEVLHLIAQAALESKDYLFCYDVCEQLIEWGHGPAWDVCVDLAEAEGYHNLKAKVELLSFAVTFCSSDMIEPVLQARSLLETQVLYEKLTVDTENTTEDRSSRSSSSPFSARAAFQQTQQILTSTKDTTKAVLSTVTDAKWWQGTLNKLKLPATKRQLSQDYNDRNKKMELQSCHPFYDGIIEHCYSDLDEADILEGSITFDQNVQMSEKVLRTAQLEEVLTQGEKSQSTSEVLLQLAGEAFPTDNTLSLAYLLALQKPTDADRCFEEHPKTDISLQLAIYYYALQIYSSVKPCIKPDISAIYTHSPLKVMEKVVSLVTQKTEFDWPEEVTELVVKIKQYNEMLADYRQGKVLKKLGRGINVERFTDDAEYKEETILGLAMTLEDNIYDISVTLAERYDIPLWQVYSAHLEFLFSDSGLSTEELEKRVTSLDILPTLKSKPEEFCKRLQAYIYPTLEGCDHARLLYYYTILTGCGITLEGGLMADAHVKLLKRVKTVLPDLDYKAIMAEGTDVMEKLSPCLSSGNINNSAKLAKQIPDGSGGTLDASMIYCIWTVKFFWEGDNKKSPETRAAWLHRYEACGEFMQKLLPRDVIRCTDGVIFSHSARQQLDIECRQDICKRVLKFCRQSINKKKKQDESRIEGGVTWEEAVTIINGYKEHLDTLISPFILSLADSEVTKVQEYLEMYDLSKGSSEEIHKLLIRVLVDGEEGLEFLQELLSVCVGKTWRLSTVIKDALDLLLLKLRNGAELPAELPDSLLNVDTLPTLQHIVENVQSYTEDGGSLVTSEDILIKLRPFCSDSSIEVQPRLDVLHILEKSFKLSEEDSRLLTLYRTQAVVTSTWEDLQISDKDIKTPASRLKLFHSLLEKNSQQETFSAVCQLLRLWPPFSDKILGSTEKNPWVCVFKAMVLSGCHGNVVDVITTVQNTPAVALSKNCTEVIYSEMLEQTYTVEAVKFCLVVGHTDIFLSAVDELCKVQEAISDSQLIELLLKHRLVPSIVQTPHYPVIIEYLLTNQDPDVGSPDHLDIEKLANQLLGKGFEAEAGSLLMHGRATHSMLHTFGSALGAVGKWLKKTH